MEDGSGNYRLYIQAWERSYKNSFIKKPNEAQELIVEKGEVWEESQHILHERIRVNLGGADHSSGKAWST